MDADEVLQGKGCSFPRSETQPAICNFAGNSLRIWGHQLVTGGTFQADVWMMRPVHQILKKTAVSTAEESEEVHDGLCQCRLSTTLHLCA